MNLDAYLERLRSSLPGDPFFRHRVLAEVEGHLRESAAAHGEEEALRRFGSVEEVASRFAPEAAARAAALAARLVGVCLAGYVAAYLAAENLLPPAPWPSADAAPLLLRVTTAASTLLYGVAAGLGAIALVLALVRRTAAALAAAVGAAVVLASACLVALVGETRRAVLYAHLDVEGRLSPAAVVVGELYLLSLAAVALGSVGWGARVWLAARRASSSYGFSS